MVLTAHNSVANIFLAELRDEQIQKDGMRFRKNMERLGQIMAYEISKTFNYFPAQVKTSLGTSDTSFYQSKIVLAPVLRAGLPFYNGFVSYFDQSETAFIAAYRGTPDTDHAFEIRMDYTAAPSLQDKILILIDPMLATGKSLLRAYESLLKYGKPEKVHVVSVISSKAGMEFATANMPDVTLWTVAQDEELNYKSYIVPGLGDAGDLAFGNKI